MASTDGHVVYTEPDRIQTVLESVEGGDELTVVAAPERGDEPTYKDNREVDFVDYGGDIQFGEPISGESRIIRPESLTVYELGTEPDNPLVNPLTIQRLIVFEEHLMEE